MVSVSKPRSVCLILVRSDDLVSEDMAVHAVRCDADRQQTRDLLQ